MNGLGIPAEMSIIGWDNRPTARLPHIQLTTVNQDTKLIARLIIERIIARNKGADISPREIILDNDLIVRKATTNTAKTAKVS
jgi:DNA-binding LacI/PurR family transcriptional regulator